ncbi:MAG TPA: hypothetical protein PKN56_23500 [Leptospiraceae bacterium]|nr:hypothetical protein [Leptospiraceae bacterium]
MELMLFFLDTVWILSFFIFLGFLFYPKGFVSGSVLINVSMWLCIGSSFSVVSSVILVRLNFPGKTFLLLLPALILYAVFRHIDRDTEFVQNRFFSPIDREDYKVLDRKTAFFALGAVFLLSLTFFYYPFIYKKSPGLYSVSGGDLSIYMRMSEFFVQNGFQANLPEHKELLPPYSNWSILTYIVSQQKGYGGGLFAGTLTALPAMTVSFSSEAEAYTISLAVSMLSAVLSTGAFLGYLYNRGGKYTFVSMIFVATSNLLLWFAASHAAPALFARGISSALLLLVALGLCSGGRVPVLGILWIGAALILVYPPVAASSLGIPLFVFFGFRLSELMFQQEGRKVSDRIKEIAFLFLPYFVSFFLIVLLSGFEYRTILNFFRFAGFQGADFGLKGRDLLLAFSGAFDFDLLFPSTVLKSSTLKAGIAASGLLYLFAAFGIFSRRNLQFSILTFFHLLVISLAAYLYLSGTATQYAGIRFTETGSIFLTGVAGIGFLILAEKLKSKYSFLQEKSVYIAFIIILFFAYMIPQLEIKNHFWSRVLGKESHDHSFFYDKTALNMADYLTQEQKKKKDSIVYWFDAGPVSFAGSEVLMRKVRYFEVYNYDYYNYIKSHYWWKDVELDILNDSYLKNAVFAFPPFWRQKIITDYSGFSSPPTKEFGEYKIYDTVNSSGAVFIGDAWNAPIKADAVSWGRYLKGREGGFVFWSVKEVSIAAEMNVIPTDKDMAVGIFHEKKNIKLRYDLPKLMEKHKVRFKMKLSKGMNVLRISPISKTAAETQWGHIKRSETPWLLFTEVNITKPEKEVEEGIYQM